MIKIIEKYPILSLVVFVIVAFGFTIDSIPVTIMEARNFISAREMLSDDHWILTTMNGEPRYQKPPLPTWITAFSAHIFGIQSVLALRWPALILLMLIGTYVYRLSLKLQLSRSHSLLNGFIALTSFYIIAIIIEAPWDIYAHGFMLMALYQLFILFQSPRVTPLTSLFFVLFLAASIMSKGPVSLYVLFLSFVITYGLSYRLKGPLMYWLKLVTLFILSLALGGFWYLYVRTADPETFIAIAARETSNWSSYNVRPFYYYWSFFVQSGIWTVFAFVSLLYPYLKSRVIHSNAYTFSFLWTITAIVLLSVIPEKKSRYLMPVLIPLAINIGFYIEYLIREFKNFKTKNEQIPVYFGFGLIALVAVCLPVIGLFIEPFSTDRFLFFYLTGTTLSVILGILMLYKLGKKEIKTVFYGLVGFIICIGAFLLPLTKMTFKDHFNPESISKYNSEAIYGIQRPSPEFLYYFGEKLPLLNKSEGILIPEEKEFYILSNDLNSLDLEVFQQIYDITYIKTFDLNHVSQEAGNYRERLVNHLYRLSLK
jgi:4-amino-4-deoxy-L-arabinose transferase-like glycosyltransferase